MEEKNIALCILGVIAVIAIVGLIMIFASEKAVANAPITYPESTARVYEERPSFGVGPGVNYYVSSGQPVIEPAKLPYPTTPAKPV